MKKTVALLAILVLVTTTGCLGFDFGPFSDPEAEDVRNDTVTAVGNLETYTFETDTFVEMSMPAEEGNTDGAEITMTFGGEGEVDVESRTMRIDSVSNIEMTAQTRESDSEIYLADGSMYVNDGEGWVRDELKDFEATWRAHDTARIAVNNMRDGDVEFGEQETETVEGDEAYVVEVENQSEEYAESVLERLRLYLAGETDERLNVSEVEIENSSATVWVDTDTMYPIRSESDILFTSTLDTGVGNAEVQISLDSSMDISNHDEPVNHELPTPP